MSNRRPDAVRLSIALVSLLPLAAACASQQSPPPATAGETAAAPLPPPPPAEDATTTKLKAALAGAHRTEKNRARDVYRHPVETLAFFGLRDNMTVVELWPGGGWFTEVLAPVLKDRGKLVITSFDPNGPPESYNTKRAKEVAELLQANKPIFGDVGVAVVAPPDKIELGPDGSADMVVTFRNLHNWLSAKPPIADKIMAAAFKVLKPGGVLGLTEHRAKPGQELKSGYVPEEEAIRLAEAAGFKLVEKSEINANPKDTKDYPDGVWTLPPTLRLKEKDREKYRAIGESDRMTLKFIKPAAPGAGGGH